MISLNMPTPVKCLQDFATMENSPKFDSLEFQDCKCQTRTYLLNNQYKQCAYCEAPLANDGNDCHLDHIESQYDNENRRFDITNLVASCQCEITCGHAHGNHSVPDDLNPYLTDRLHETLPCKSNGELDLGTLPSPASTFADKKLNLNSPGLKSRREAIILGLMQHTLASGTNARRRIKDLSTNGKGFYSLHYQYLGRYGFPPP